MQASQPPRLGVAGWLRRVGSPAWGRWLGRRGSPEALAGGAALGLFVALTPTLGVQLILAAALASLFRVSRATAIVPVWITNPITAPPIYGFLYVVGSWLWTGEMRGGAAGAMGGLLTGLRAAEVWDVSEQLGAVASLGREVLIPLWLGSLAIGLPASALVYFGVVTVVRRARRRNGRQVRPAPPVSEALPRG